MNRGSRYFVVFEMTIYILTFIAFFAMIFSSIEIIETYQILKDDFFAGELKVEKFECVNINNSNSAIAICSAKGDVYSKNGRLICEGQTVLLESHPGIDFEKKEFNVYYRKNCLFPIWNKYNESSLSKKKYKEKILFLFIPHFSLILLVMMALKLNNKL